MNPLNQEKRTACTGMDRYQLEERYGWLSNFSSACVAPNFSWLHFNLAPLVAMGAVLRTSQST
jgi:hypothetical protein